MAEPGSLVGIRSFIDRDWISGIQNWAEVKLEGRGPSRPRVGLGGETLVGFIKRFRIEACGHQLWLAMNLPSQGKGQVGRSVPCKDRRHGGQVFGDMVNG